MTDFIFSNIISLISFSIVLVGIIMFIYKESISKKNNNLPVKKNDKHHYAILIPARYESSVIEGILLSIKNQSMKVDMRDVYVIVESLDDPTVLIGKKYKTTIILRKDLCKKRKGYALDDAIKEILSCNKKYDAYFIFDADNVLDKDYLLNMTKSFDMGYDIGIGYRNSKNGNDSVVAASSTLTFSMVNTLSNNNKKERTNTMTISGTGFYIRGYLIEKWKGYPFNSLTEDYELSLYACLKSLTTDYNTNAVFYDEQPVKYRQTVNQRIRWIRGYFDVRKKYVPKLREKAKEKNNNYGSQVLEIIGVKPFVYMVVGISLFLINQLVFMIKDVIVGDSKWIYPVSRIIEILFVVYLIIFIVTYLMLFLEKDKLDINKKMMIKVLFFNPLYLATYVPCAIKAMLKKEVTWDRVEHNRIK